MIDRKTIKTRAKAAFKANYWRCVLVALIVASIIGSGAATSKNKADNSLEEVPFFAEYDYNKDGKLDNDETKAMLDGAVKQYGEEAVRQFGLAILGGLAAVAAVGALLTILVVNPLLVGCRWFFTRNAEEPAKLGELGRGFSPAWLRNVVTMLLIDIYVALWCVLFVIPGIVKAYSYRLAPYIQAEHPEMRSNEAITLSRRMMNGHKWEAFVFDLSFLGWQFLAALTAEVLGVLYVNPYKSAADAELYRTLRDQYQE